MQFHEAKKFILGKLKNELPKHLAYHNLDHIQDVYEAAERIAEKEGIKEKDLVLLLTAALLHDSGFIFTNKGHEKISCEIAKQILPDYEYSEEEIKKICGMIMATHIPQTPHNKLEQIICDADLDYLGRDDFFFLGNKLFDELSMFGIVDGENEWNNFQMKFLEAHHYFTPSSKKIRTPKKEEHLAVIKSKIN